MKTTRSGRGLMPLLLLLAVVAPAQARAHGEFACRLPAAPPQTNVNSPFLEHSYRFLSELARRCPTSRQAAMMAAAETVYQVVWAWRPSPPTAADVAGAEQTVRNALARVERDTQTVRIEVGAGGPRAEPRKPLRAALGLEGYVALRLTNGGAAEVTILPRIAGVALSPVTVPPMRRETDDARWVLAPWTPERTGSQTLEVRLGDAGTLRLPAVVERPALLRGRILDAETDKPWPGRVTVQGSDGVLRHGEAFKSNTTLSEKPVVFRPASYRLPFFYSDGSFEVVTPPGATRITLERGFEHGRAHLSVQLRAGETCSITLSLRRFTDLRKMGWVSGDTHVHWVRNSWDVNEELGLLGMVQRAEDVRVVNNLTLYQYRPADQGGAFVKPDHHPMGPVSGMCDDAWHVQMAEEYRNDNHYGHINLLGLTRLIEPIAAGAGSGGPVGAPDWPTNRPIIEQARQQGGISIEAHNLGPFMASAVAANVVMGLSDSLDQLDAEVYYRFLNCGVHIGLSNGSDHPARVVGCARVYARMPRAGGRLQPFTYARWLAAVRTGRTFTTSGPLLLLKVNGSEPGDTLDLPPGAMLGVEVRALSRDPLGVVEIVANGRVLKSVRTRGRSCTVRLKVRADESRWFCARASRNGVWNAILSPDVAHTSAVYTRVGGREVMRAADARFYVANLQEHVRRLEAMGVFENAGQRAQAVAEAREGIARYEAVAAQAAKERPAP
ncbi:MAG: CehA/McbA family metallohydrolase [Armatimonadetes bacterium]|nr:CehA/McbA family metallohydrolase [Armatimonadota bacterium]